MNKQLTMLHVVKGLLWYAFAIFSFFTFVSVATSAPSKTYSNREILDAIRQVETGGLPNEGRGAIGDGGTAIGPYQIHRIYHVDSGLPTYSKCKTSKSYSERVVSAYMMRYACGEWTRSLNGQATLADVEKIARIHNGGPRGYRKVSTEKYWTKAKKALG